MSCAAIETLLRDTVGLDAASLGAGAVERAVRERLRACRLSGIDAYFERARSDKEELQELIEAVVVPETWFFRNREAYAALVALVQSRGALTGSEPLRLLSLPCATGEEPYSLAIALLDAGVPGECFRIDAIDISARALEAARNARYGANSFRGTDAGFYTRHFVACTDRQQLSDNIRRQVSFHHGNLLDTASLLASQLYDFVFCRNLLIYFNSDAQVRAIAVLRRLLRPNGVLFVGSSEASLLLSHDFHSLRLPMAFAFRHPETAALRASPRVDTRSALCEVLQPALQAPRTIPTRSTSATDSPAPTSPIADLAAAAHLSDQGRLAEAAQLCEAHLRVQPASVQALYLLGVIEDARGNIDVALGLYRKALYLDPNHQEVLAHLIYLLERSGDADRAHLLRQRLNRQTGARS
jgi:chemotaxis protein methyltransferase WspC